MKKNQKVIFLKSGAKKTEIFEFLMDKQETCLEFFVFFILKNNDFLKLKTITKHIVPKTSAFTFVRGVVYDEAKISYEGLIKIEPKAIKTSAYLKSDILLLGERAKAECIPSLEIKTNDVKASHGVSIGRFDPEQIFYMKSRGLSKEKFYELAIFGFFESLIEKIDSLKLRTHMRELLFERYV